MSGPVLSPSEKAAKGRRKWWAISVGTLLETFASAGIFLGLFLPAVTEGAEASPGSLIVGVAAVPLAFVALAFVSGNPRAPIGVLQAMGLFLVAGPVVAVTVDPVSALVLAFGAGGVVALRAGEGQKRRRWAAVVLAAIVVAVLVRIDTGAALVIAPLLPFISLGIADLTRGPDGDVSLSKTA